MYVCFKVHVGSETAEKKQLDGQQFIVPISASLKSEWDKGLVR